MYLDYFAVSIFFSIIISALVFDYMNRLFKHSYTGSYKKYYLFLTCMLILLRLFHKIDVIYIGVFLYFFILCKKLYYSNSRNIYVYTLLFLCCIISVEEIIFILFDIFSSLEIIQSMNHISQALYVYICSILVDLLMYWVFVKSLMQNKNIKSMNHIMRLLIFILSTFIIIELIVVYNVPIYTKYYALMMCILILTINISILIFMEKKHNEYKHRNNTNTPFKYKYANIEKELNQPFEYEKFLHDMKEHLFVLEALYGTADHDRAKDYHDKLMKKIVSFKKFSNDPILQALLSKICKDCEINNIEFVYSIKGESALSELSDFDKVTIFSNILNNAYEAALLCTPPNKYINFKILKLNHAIVIYVRKYITPN